MSDCAIIAYFVVRAMLPEPAVDIVQKEGSMQRCERLQKTAVAKAELGKPPWFGGMPLLTINCIPCAKYYDKTQYQMVDGLLNFQRKLLKRELSKAK